MVNKKGVMSNLIKFILWAIFIGIVLIAVYFLGKKLGVGT